MKRTLILTLALLSLIPLHASRLRKTDPFLITAVSAGPVRLGMSTGILPKLFPPPEYVIVRNAGQIKIVRRGITQLIIPVAEENISEPQVIRRIIVLSYDYRTREGVSCGLAVTAVMKRLRQTRIMRDPENLTEYLIPAGYQKNKSRFLIELTSSDHSPVGYRYQRGLNGYETTRFFRKNGVIESFQIIENPDPTRG